MEDAFTKPRGEHLAHAPTCIAKPTGGHLPTYRNGNVKFGHLNYPSLFVASHIVTCYMSKQQTGHSQGRWAQKECVTIMWNSQKKETHVAITQVVALIFFFL